MPPPPWSTGAQGSFAHRTLAERVPKILEDTVAAQPEPFPGRVLQACAELLEELRHGRLRGLREDAPDRVMWDQECAPHVGRSWLDVPWYFAESFFYRRVLEAVEYFGARAGADPFLVVKAREEESMMPRVQQARSAAASTQDPQRALLHGSLWGNRADLSHPVGRAFGERGDAEDLLVDDTAPAVAALQGARRVAFLLDNAGTELAMDLVWADHLARAGVAVTLLAKPHPFFVSDATPVDVERTRALLGLPALPVRTHPHFTSSRFLRTPEMPPDLVDLLSRHDVVVAKGDANYRRLVADAPWPFHTPACAALQFPAPVLALRTCKSEVLVGVSETTAARAQARDPNWLVHGRFGLIQWVPCLARASS